MYDIDFFFSLYIFNVMGFAFFLVLVCFKVFNLVLFFSHWF